MQRGTYVISLAAQAVEGALVARGESQPAFHQTLFAPAEEAEAAGGAGGLLDAFLTQAAWERGLATLVLPTAAVSTRRLRFQFSEPRKVRQVLPLEIQGELLDPLDAYAHDAEILPVPEGGAEALVVLTPKADLDALAEVIERHQLLLHRVTFAAQALAESVPVGSANHFCVYLGSDESSVAHLVDGRFNGCEALSAHPGAELEGLRALGGGSPLEQLRSVVRAPEDDTERVAVRERLQEALAAAVAEANRFLRIHGAGAPFTVSIHGLFAEACLWREDLAELEARLPVGDWPQAHRTHFGVLETLMRQPRRIAGARGINLRRRMGTWVATLRELRWPLVAAAVLVVLLGGIVFSGFQLRAGALQARLERLDSELRRSLGMNVRVTAATVDDALRRLQEQVDRLRRDQEALAYLERYNYDVLRLLRDVSDVVADVSGVTVEAVSMSRERMTVSGVTPTYADAENLRNRIAALPRFEGKTVKVTNAAAGQVIRYRLTVEP